MVKNLHEMWEDLTLILGFGRSLGEGNGYPLQDSWGILGGSDGKESACNTEDLGLIPGSGRSLGEGNGNPLQYSCLENSMDRESGGLQSMGLQRVRHEQIKGADDVLKWVKIPALVLNVETWWIIPALWSVFPFVKQIGKCTAERYKLLWGQLLPLASGGGGAGGKVVVCLGII